MKLNLTRTALLTCWLSLAIACRQPAAPKTDSLDDIARSYVKVALALGERDPDSLDFSIAPASITAEIHHAYPGYDAITRDALALQARLSRLPSDPKQDDRVKLLAGNLEAIVARVELLRGHGREFDDEAHLLFATRRLPDRFAEQRSQLTTQINQLLPAGRGDATARYAVYTRRFLVAPDKLAAVMNAALASCRQETAQHLALPDGERVELQFVRNQPWSAFSRYRGAGKSTIRVNLDFPLTVDEALELACHEGYPGHHVFNTLHDAALGSLPEMQVQLTFSPQSYLSEAAAAYAPRIALSTDERTRLERDVLFPIAQLPRDQAGRYVKITELVRGLDSAEPALARDYLDGRLEFVRAAAALGNTMLMAHPEASLLYMNEYRTYMLAYTDGPRRVEQSVHGHWPEFQALMTGLHPGFGEAD